jgi:dTDP-4-dehydrorhamnose reductase
MKIMVMGREGQLARSLAEREAYHPAMELKFVGRPKTDLATPGKFAEAIEANKPDIVINAAAFTAVDAAEEGEALAYQVNAEAPREGAVAAARLGIPFVQISTDYVFNGGSTRLWREEDSVDPINAYGRTKAEGERQVLAASPHHLIVRTSWLVGPFGHNFVKTMLRLAAERDEIAVVDDQRGRPTETLVLADGLLTLSDLARTHELGGIWHLAGSGDATWAELAEEVMKASAAHGGATATIRRISTEEYPTPAARPRNSVLDCRKAKDKLGIALSSWRDFVSPLVERLRSGSNGQ